MAILLFYVNFPDRATAEQISEKLINKRLIACANIHAISSAYVWSGVMCKEDEWNAIFKTTPEKESETEAYILKNHPYQTPCIMSWQVSANESYEEWIRSSLT
jgi:periplasmic divalent cation tolerance protein